MTTDHELALLTIIAIVISQLIGPIRPWLIPSRKSHPKPMPAANQVTPHKRKRKRWSERDWDIVQFVSSTLTILFGCVLLIPLIRDRYLGLILVSFGFAIGASWQNLVWTFDRATRRHRRRARQIEKRLTL
jgi:hypothetical protein